jgi:hypothetical protein
MKILVAALATAAFAVPAFAQDATAELPVCSKEVVDRCVQGPAAQRQQREEFSEKSLGNDRSRQMTPAQAKAGKKPQ